ncbi:MAG: RluA family pseudouridine synthase [Candidatus Moraniibacteriota bacterium]
MKPDGEKKIILEIPRWLVDRRLDVAVFDLLRKKFPENDFSRGSIARLIKSGRIFLNGASTRADYLVKLHDNAEVRIEDLSIASPELRLGAGDVDIPVLYDDASIAVIDKPAGVQTHPAGSMGTGTVAHWVIAHYPEVRGIGENALRPGIVHRLDRETSGVLVIAKTAPAFQALKRLFQDREIEKKYIALVYGTMPALQGEIDKPLMQRSGELKRLVVETQHVPEGARQALTSYRVLARYEGFDLLEVAPKTGRTHQIRAHLASLGHPIVGDKLYAWKPMRRGEKLFSSRQMLHAHRLRFELFSKKHVFEAPLPPDFRTVLRSIDETREAGYDDEALKSLLSA